MEEKTFMEKLNQIRAPKQPAKKKSVRNTCFVFAAGILLGVFSKWLDNLALDSTIWWHGIIERIDLGNFFSDLAVWLLAALVIAVFSTSALRAALHVFVFFAGSCAAYHLYTIAFSGFNPASYMLLWYGVTLLSPFLAVLCWYAKGSGALSVVLGAGIFAVFSLSCFSIGLFYISFRGILYLMVFVGAAAVLYHSPKQLLIALPAGVLLAFLLSPFWPYH